MLHRDMHSEPLLVRRSRPISPAMISLKYHVEQHREEALATALDSPTADRGRLLAACDGDTALLERVMPFASLVRRDSFDRYMVIPTEIGRAHV